MDWAICTLLCWLSWIHRSQTEKDVNQTVYIESIPHAGTELATANGHTVQWKVVTTAVFPSSQTVNMTLKVEHH